MLKMIKNNFLFIICMIVFIGYAIVWHITDTNDVIKYDGWLYYQYFTRVFMEHNFVGSECIKYPLGTTLLQLPFLLIAYVIGWVGKMNYEGGYAPLFQNAVYIASVFYCVAGLVLIYKMLKKKYKSTNVAITCGCILWGTMLVFYATNFASFSHVYGFFTCVCFWYYINWYESVYMSLSKGYKIGCDLFLGILLAIVALIRNTNIIIGFVYLLYRVTSFDGFVKRLKKIFTSKIVVQILGFMLVYGTQLIAWRLQVGSWILYSYGDETFTHLTDPRIGNVLFSDAKGLFIYSPILFAAMVGMISERKRNPEFCVAQWIIFWIQTYIIAAWWGWWLGAAYGERMYCDLLIIFVEPLVGIWEGLKEQECEKKECYKGKYITVELGVRFLLICFVILNIIWLIGCERGVISYNMGTWYMLKSQLFG